MLQKFPNFSANNYHTTARSSLDKAMKKRGFLRKLHDAHQELVGRNGDVARERIATNHVWLKTGPFPLYFYSTDRQGPFVRVYVPKGLSRFALAKRDIREDCLLKVTLGEKGHRTRFNQSIGTNITVRHVVN